MNREQRRKFNKQHKTHYTREDFLQIELYQALRAGDLDINSMTPEQMPEGFHVDNEELVPEGTEVKLNYELIKGRKGVTNKYLEWIEAHKDEVLHVTREEANSSLVCVKEDVKQVKENFMNEDRDMGHVPWLFDIYSDFLYHDEETNEWIPLGQWALKKEAKEN